MAERTSRFTEDDIYLFNEGSLLRVYDKFGAHLVTRGGEEGSEGGEGRGGEPGAQFAVWAPNASEVSVMGDFNEWQKGRDKLGLRGDSGIWEGFVPGVEKGARYVYHVVSRDGAYRMDKADPVGFYAETPPAKASIVWDLDYAWGDERWMKGRGARQTLKSPISIYELHLGSFMRVPEEGNRHLSYRELASKLVDYIKKMGFTHVELLPVMEHPFYGSWGYQVTGYYAPTSRYGTPQDLMYLIDTLHQNDIGVILDWVPSHFPSDGHGLTYFDGTYLYEHADPRKGYHPDWNSLIFNYGRNEVRSYLFSNALFWLDKYHADGLRVDAVASMLYLDYSRNAGDWVPNQYGGRENLEAIAFLRRMNEEVYKAFPDVQTIAEESTAWPMVSRPLYVGGLGFGLKWDMGWMHDTLSYMSKDPMFRRYHHNLLTFRQMYATSENFVVTLSHDEVVHGKGSLFAKMAGDEWQKFANLRLLFGYMYTQTAKKMLFMGGEFGQRREWNHDASLDFHLVQEEPHRRLQRWVEDLNRLYKEEPALHELDCDARGWEWIDANAPDESVLSYLRRGEKEGETILVVGNFAPIVRHNYRIGVPEDGYWKEILNSDAVDYGGSGVGNLGGVEAAPVPAHGRPFSLTLSLPPLGIMLFKLQCPEPR